MTLQEIHSNEELRQHEFPVAKGKIFLAHAGVCPLPRRVAEAIRRYADRCTHGDQETILPAAQLQKSRELAARLVGAQPDEIAFVGPTSLALSFIAGGLRFRKNDNILVYFEDYPSNVYPWMALTERRVAVRFLSVEALGRIRPGDVLGQIDDQTRLVALASCHFLAGYRIDFTAIGERLRARNILFCVDAIQTVGAFPTPVTNIDFLAADAHKWMLGPCAAGILYVRQVLQQELQPIAYGWHNVRCPHFVTQENIVLRQGSQRYEAGTHNLLGLVGLTAGIELLLEVGVGNIAAELLRKRAWLVPALERKGYTVLEREAPSVNASSIVTFHQPGTDMVVVHERLLAANIVTSLRSDRSGQRYIRLSPHFYNTDVELHRLWELL